MNISLVEKSYQWSPACKCSWWYRYTGTVVDLEREKYSNTPLLTHNTQSIHGWCAIGWLVDKNKNANTSSGFSQSKGYFPQIRDSSDSLATADFCLFCKPDCR